MENSQTVSLDAKGSNRALCASMNTTVLLATAIIQVLSADDKHRSFRTLFDSRSQSHLITCNAVQHLGLISVKCETNLSGLGGIAAEITDKVSCSIATNARYLFEIDLYILSNVCGDQPIAKINTAGCSHINSLPLADPGFDILGPIDFLLGVDIFAECLLDKHIKCKANQLLAIDSVFGWLLLGRTSFNSSSFLISTSNNLTKTVESFWEVDSLPCASSLTPDELAFEQNFITSHYCNSIRRYVVSLPFKEGVEPEFEGSRDIALKRFQAVERSLARDPNLRH